MHRKASVSMYGQLAGYLVEDEDGFHFTYTEEYLAQEHCPAISLTLPKQADAYHSDVLFAFFDGLIPEGWLLNIAHTIGLNAKQEANACKRILSKLDKNVHMVTDSFLSPELQVEYLAILQERKARLMGFGSGFCHKDARRCTKIGWADL